VEALVLHARPFVSSEDAEEKGVQSERLAEDKDGWKERAQVTALRS